MDFAFAIADVQRTELAIQYRLPTQTPVGLFMQQVGSSGPNMVAEESRISTTAGICGGVARIKGTRIPVWGLERARRSRMADNVILSMFPAITLPDLFAAWQYVNANQQAIDQQIAANEG